MIITSFTSGAIMAMSAMMPSMIGQKLFKKSYMSFISKLGTISTISGALTVSLFGIIADYYQSFTPLFMGLGIVSILAYFPVSCLTKRSQ